MLCRWTCETDWAQHGVPFQPDSLGGTRGWPLITTTSCEPVNSDPLTPELPQSLDFEASNHQAVPYEEFSPGTVANEDTTPEGDNATEEALEEDSVGDGDDEEGDANDEEDEGSDDGGDGGIGGASAALALMRSMIVNRITQQRG